MNSVGQHVADPIERLMRFVEPASAALSTANFSTAYASEGGQVTKRFTACPDTADMPARR